MNEIIELLKLSPGLGITLGFIFAAFIAWMFKDLIILYVKKKYDLFNITEITRAIDESILYKVSSGEFVERFNEISSHVVEKLKSWK